MAGALAFAVAAPSSAAPRFLSAAPVLAADYSPGLPVNRRCVVGSGGVVHGVAAVAAVLVAAGVASRRQAGRGRRPDAAAATARRAGGFGEAPAAKSAAMVVKKASKEQQKIICENALTKLFAEENPDIMEMRTCLQRLAKLVSRPNQEIIGDWLMEWEDILGSSEQVFGSGSCVESWNLKFQDYCIRFAKKGKEKVCEAVEIIRKTGPFPDSYNRFEGTYEVTGMTGLTVNFTKLTTEGGQDVKASDGTRIQEKSFRVDVIYSSDRMMALQSEKNNGECNFYVLKKVESIDLEAERFVGYQRRKFLFN